MVVRLDADQISLYLISKEFQPKCIGLTMLNINLLKEKIRHIFFHWHCRTCRTNKALERPKLFVSVGRCRRITSALCGLSLLFFTNLCVGKVLSYASK